MEKPEQDRRNAVRRRVLKGAQIIFNDRAAVIDCVVRDLSERGARIKVESPMGIPDSFELVLEAGSLRNCRVAWRTPTLIGVAFSPSRFGRRSTDLSLESKPSRV
jgi:PilZ domain